MVLQPKRTVGSQLLEKIDGQTSIRAVERCSWNGGGSEDR